MSLITIVLCLVLTVIGVTKTPEFRATARKKLGGKWGKAVLMTLAYAVISLLLSILSGLFASSPVLSLLISLAVAIIGIPLSFGLSAAFLKLYRSEEVGSFDFLSTGLSNFVRSWAVSLRMLLKLLGPILVFILALIVISGSLVFSAASVITGGSSSGGIGAIIGFILYIVGFIWLITKSYYYVMSYYVAIDSPELTAKEAVEQSREFMTNNRAKCFWLQISFTGWLILATLPIGIGLLWLFPYMTFAEIALYHVVSNKDDNTVAEEVSNNTEF